MWPGRSAKGLSRLFGASPADEPISPEDARVEVGDGFYEVAVPHSVWIVERFVKSQACDIPHVIITRSGVAPASKIISTAVLLDKKFYRRDRRESDSENIDNHRRRTTDLPQC